MYKVWSSYGGRGLLALAVLLSMGLVGGCGGVGGSDVGEGVALSRSTRIVPNGVSAFAAKADPPFQASSNVEYRWTCTSQHGQLLNANGDLPPFVNTSGLATYCANVDGSGPDTVEVEITRVLKDGKRIQAATMSATITVESTFIPCEIRQVILQPRSYVTGNGPWQETRWAAAINVILVWKLDMRTPNYRMRYAFNGSQPTWDMGVGPDEYYTFYNTFLTFGGEFNTQVAPDWWGLKAGEAANTAPDSGPPGAYGSFDGISREQAQAWLDEKLSNSEGAWSITQNWTTAFEAVH